MVAVVPDTVQMEVVSEAKLGSPELAETVSDKEPAT
jgi:hypothetical protein